MKKTFVFSCLIAFVISTATSEVFAAEVTSLQAERKIIELQIKFHQAKAKELASRNSFLNIKYSQSPESPSYHIQKARELKRKLNSYSTL